MAAKTKRLACFNVELSRPMENPHDASARHKASLTKCYQAALDKRNADDPAEDAMGILSDYEGMESSTVVVGLCPDMCPESEREERERKGDLDKYERLDGDRNQTSKFIAVKKYNRTAEREADLIRPMPVLQKTVDYLLHLLDRPYNENFLSIYNFMWDRMRAIRMELRMQHIFNREAIVMLEQMIRLHVIAMHELCEYKKGEGFSDGFDGHLNIEQMNKTSVELFQMYDDHRKQGISVPTEKEFRGYYALLKLDKHPGYKVEPAELSLDLAKMTSEIRCTPEILFARDVARACRIGNYIAFFRLARKATYLEACLMHAHFAKLRTQALASLHSGLQNNQGIPIPDIVKWLGMEGEDIESLLEYHGFAIKKYEDTYMMKEGPFLNLDADFPTNCSQLVQLKKSRNIVDDIYSGRTLLRLTREKEIVSDMVEPKGKTSWFSTVDEEMLDHKVDSVLTAMTPTPQSLEGSPTPTIMHIEDEAVITEGSLSGASWVPLDDSRKNHVQLVEDGLVLEPDVDIFMDERNLPKFEADVACAGVPGGSSSGFMIANFYPKAVVEISPDTKASAPVPRDQDGAAGEKLKLILRKWKQQASIRKEIREQREYVANEALSILSLGPPIWKNKALSYPKHTTGNLNIDSVARERDGREAKSWSSLNVSELVAPVLSARNLDCRCICWKVAVFVQANGTENQTDLLASRWLLSKLRGKESDDGLIVSSSHFSIWKKWVETHQTCCLSVVREAMFDLHQSFVEDDVITGTCSIMFVVSETIPWETQKGRLNVLLTSVPPGANLPLLVVSVGTSNELEIAYAIIQRLGLGDADRTKISTFSVVSVAGDLNGYFDDDRLREGLKWLANHSPLQPSLHMLRTRELVLSSLRHLTDGSDVGPEHCISAFNKALDRVAEEVTDAASVNPNHWPCPEIDLIKRLSSERIVADISLPSTGWSSAARIEPIVRAIKGCKLPSFPDDVTSWLNQGCHEGRQIRDQKLAIEEWLIGYLMRSSGLVNVDLSAREASVMLQKGAGLELRGSCYHIVPRWPVIFRRIYNWQLMKLAVGEFSVAYVLERLDGHVPPPLNDDITVEGNQASNPVRTELTLDEMVEISCRVPSAPQQPSSIRRPVFKSAPQQPSSISRPVCSPPGIDHKGGDLITEGNIMCGDPGCGGDYAGAASVLVERNKDRLGAPLAAEKNNRLAMLLQRCNALQDMIAEKLYYYF